jgi:hypothetical protein
MTRPPCVSTSGHSPLRTSDSEATRLFRWWAKHAQELAPLPFMRSSLDPPPKSVARCAFDIRRGRRRMAGSSDLDLPEHLQKAEDHLRRQADGLIVVHV